MEQQSRLSAHNNRSSPEQQIRKIKCAFDDDADELETYPSSIELQFVYSWEMTGISASPSASGCAWKHAGDWIIIIVVVFHRVDVLDESAQLAAQEEEEQDHEREPAQEAKLQAQAPPICLHSQPVDDFEKDQRDLTENRLAHPLLFFVHQHSHRRA